MDAGSAAGCSLSLLSALATSIHRKPGLATAHSTATRARVRRDPAIARVSGHSSGAAGRVSACPPSGQRAADVSVGRCGVASVVRRCPDQPRSTSAPPAGTRARAGPASARAAASGTRSSRRSASRGAAARGRGARSARARAAVKPVALRDVAAAEHERLRHRHRRARQRARGRDRARLAGADRRRAGHRQVDADDDGAGQPARCRPAHAVRLGRGVGGPDPAAGRAAARRRARHPGDRRDRSRMPCWRRSSTSVPRCA